ncbi:MAG: hypothetical protein C4324_02215 [Blastocatellia bacterium]
MCRKFFKLKLLASIVVFASVAVAGQKTKTVLPTPPEPAAAIRGTAAYAEILLRKAETDAELDALSADYTDDFPRIKELKFSAGLLTEDLARLNSVKPEEVGRLTVALGKLMIKRLDAAIELWKLRQSFADNYPDVRRALRKWEIFDKAVKEILGQSK